MKNVLVVGGAGYIGAHQVRYLLDNGFKVVVFDNLSTGHREFLDSRATFVQGDLLNITNVRKAFSYPIDAVMHFASFIQMGESVENPLKYYENNIIGVLNLLRVMREKDVKHIIFSSSAGVYGDPSQIPITEDENLKPINPYGKTKMMIEHILRDCDHAHGIKHVSLRYFNAAGAAYGLGELHEPESHLIPNILVSVLKNKSVKLFGNDYPTEDGTCVRDYIHVLDLVRAHHLALELLFTHNESKVYNLGSGQGYSVKQVVQVCEEVTKQKVHVEFCPRRPGDTPSLIASSEKISKELGWKPEFGLKEIISSTWEWHKTH